MYYFYNQGGKEPVFTWKENKSENQLLDSNLTLRNQNGDSLGQCELLSPAFEFCL